MTDAGAEWGPRRHRHMTSAFGAGIRGVCTLGAGTGRSGWNRKVSLRPREGGGGHAVVRAVESAAAEAALGDRR